VLSAESQQQLKTEIAERMVADRAILDSLRSEIRPLRSQVRRIQPRSTTSISLVGTDGGNNSLQFDPFLVQIVRIVDSSNNEYCLEAITPTTSVTALAAQQFDQAGAPVTALGEMMAFLRVSELTALSHMIRRTREGEPTSPTWVQVYRELVEWAVLFRIIREKDFGSDTLILFDGLLRSKVFARDLFQWYLRGLREGIQQHLQRSRRRIYLAGMAKHSKVLARYRLAMALESVLSTEYPAFVAIPRDIEEKAYIWSEYARGNDRVEEGGEVNKFVGGRMFFAKFGNSPRDPIWPVDIFDSQINEAPTIFGCLLADAINGFPVPHYPLCLQKAHENAAMIDFDFDIVQDQVFDGIRDALAGEAMMLDIFRLQDADPSQRRY